MTDIAQATNDSVNARANAIAMSAVDNLSAESTSLIQYTSRGRVAVIGNSEAQEFASRLTGNLTAQIILRDGAVEPGVPTLPVGNRRLLIEGYLGNFTIFLGEEGQIGYESLNVDLILDLSAEPLLTMPLKPPGYLTSIAEEPYLTEVEETLKGLTGTFEKPRYFSYNASICAHGRSGISGCTKCIDACPAEAITSLSETIQVNANLCQGGGICVSACPTGAIRYVYPTATDTLRSVRTLLQNYTAAQGSKPVIAFIAADEFELLTHKKPDNLLVVVIEELASVGIEIWLSAIAYGANSVLLIDAGLMPPSVAEFLHQQVKTAEAILSGLGYTRSGHNGSGKYGSGKYGSGKNGSGNNGSGMNGSGESESLIRVVDIESLYQQCDISTEVNLTQVASFTGSPEKRSTTLRAIDFLYQQSTTAKPIISLPAESLFGRITVDGQKCTLCMSCVSVCPSKAVIAGNDTPKLEFHEANCVQCGICVAACPEQAISLEPRLIANAIERAHPVTLHEDEPFCCIQCGKAFATKSIIDTMARKLTGHYMFQSERAKQRLLMCQDCRVVDVVQDEEMMGSV